MPNAFYVVLKESHPSHIARHSDFTMKNLLEQPEAGFAKVTDKTCAEIIKDVRKIEDDFWTEDLQFDEQEID